VTTGNAHIQWNAVQSVCVVHTPLFLVGRLPPIFLRVVVMTVVGAVVAAVTDERVWAIDVIPPCQPLLSTRLMYALPANKTFLQFNTTHLFEYSNTSHNSQLIPCVIGCTTGGTKPASFWCDSTSLCSSMNVCSMLRNVVGVRVGVVRVGTPEFSPSSVTNC
jgi:hypothetical protein